MAYVLNTLLWLLVLLSGNLIFAFLWIAIRDGLKKKMMAVLQSLVCVVVFGWLHYLSLITFIKDF
ncbi:hypothetical protein MOA67_gp219 [Klebsiella phage KpLz-2_45]|uniref:hypothetical protein n=1 Tax=Klebsiella phage KpLz-2_45 TaxID=2698923 RepID=UPI001F12B5DB|nr:hypothetical protein MOA67_gp219 [Klebsiella phage KpLz-2_45]UKS72204.1 hypothetical protein KpLz245_3380 [Klebsiella phage KpLz-2_45]